ncbi:interleukin-8-like [Hypanus sabinus]|uniref:interleukin-8-like n=1 Tax=Hypanus sabinus TaxID=79690 RepID=UPI0028C3B48E|nr:interleukin-8-like [Hypanus sabinus]
MNCSTAITILLLLGYCAAFSNAAPRDENESLRCHCTYKEERKIPTKQITKAIIYPSSTRCKHTEIIVTITSGYEICVKVTAAWVKNLIDYLLENSTAGNIS